MKRFIQNIQWIFIFLLVWIVLFEEFSIRTAISGLAVACLCLLFTEKYLMGDSYSRLYPINIPWLLKYIIFLLFEIYRAGISTTIKVFSGNITPGIVEIETSLESEFSRIILANSITLTPGTVTIAKEGNKLKVLWLNVETKDPEKAGMLIKKNLERVLKKG